MTREQLPEGSYFTIGRRIGLGAVAAAFAAVLSVYIGVLMELNSHKSRLDMLERATVNTNADHDAITRVLVIQEQMAGQLKRIEGYLMEGRERPAGR